MPCAAQPFPPHVGVLCLHSFLNNQTAFYEMYLVFTVYVRRSGEPRTRRPCSRVSLDFLFNTKETQHLWMFRWPVKNKHKGTNTGFISWQTIETARIWVKFILVLETIWTNTLNISSVLWGRRQAWPWGLAPLFLPLHLFQDRRLRWLLPDGACSLPSFLGWTGSGAKYRSLTLPNGA